MLKKLTRAEAHKAMDEWKTIWTHNRAYCAYRSDSNPEGPYVYADSDDMSECVRMTESWDRDWYIEVEEPWRPVEGEAVYSRGHRQSAWAYSVYSHTDKRNEYPFYLSGGISVKMIATVKGNEGSAGTTKELKNTLTAEDLK